MKTKKRIKAMDKDTREFLHQMREDLNEMRKDIQDLIAWKNKIMGVFIAVSVICSFLFNEIKSKFNMI